jgi:hypothetical protein
MVFGVSMVFGDAMVYGDAQVFGVAKVFGDAQVFGDAWVYGGAQVFGDAQVYGDAKVLGDAKVYGDAQVSTVCSVTPKVITGLQYTLTITDEHLRAGCQVHTFQEWRNKTEREVLAMDVKAALVFYKETLIPLMDVLKLGV